MEYITPVITCDDLDKENEIFIKRDDLLPFSFGGNKVRIAQEFFADMEAQGKNCLVGYGNARSNLCRVLANMSYAKTGKEGFCHIISPADDDGTVVETYNRLIAQSCGAVIHSCTKQNVAETVTSVLKQCEEEGMKPYYIYGDATGHGNEAVPVRAYVKVYQEIAGKYDYIFLATGTGMTQAGLIAGKMLRHGSENIVGISIARQKEREIPVIQNYLNNYIASIGKTCPSEEVYLEDDYIGSGYGSHDEKISETIQMMMKRYGIPLDTTYTGKAFYGMLDFLKRKKIKGKRVIFIHTGGAPLFFDKAEAIFSKK